jgi:hypothetical protein
MDPPTDPFSPLAGRFNSSGVINDSIIFYHICNMRATTFV